MLKAKGYPAQRIPLSGATTFAKGDVIVQSPAGDVLIEVKARANGFKTIYEDLSKSIADMALFELTEGKQALVTTNIVRLFSDTPVAVTSFTKESRSSKSLVTAQKMLGEASMLALKANNKPFLFVTFFDSPNETDLDLQ
jgi:Holliday junction resolvase